MPCQSKVHFPWIQPLKYFFWLPALEKINHKFVLGKDQLLELNKLFFPKKSSSHVVLVCYFIIFSERKDSVGRYIIYIPGGLIQQKHACEIALASVLEEWKNCIVMPEPTILKMVLMYWSLGC